jgi:hypothetical protein
MRQVRIRTTCDPCQAWHGTENDDGVTTVAVAGGQTLDLCPSHRDDLAPFLALVAEWGATPERNGSGRKRTTTVARASAPEAPAEAPRAPNRRGGARARARRANGAAQVPADNGGERLVCPLCGGDYLNVESLGVHTRTQHGRNLSELYGGTCPLCGHVGDPRGLGTHASKAHQAVSTAHLFAEAQRQGDPHGIISSRAQAVAATVSG